MPTRESMCGRSGSPAPFRPDASDDVHRMRGILMVIFADARLWVGRSNRAVVIVCETTDLSGRVTGERGYPTSGVHPGVVPTHPRTD